MSTMKSKWRPQEGADPVEQPPEEVVDRLAELLPEGALDDAVRGLRPEELSGPGGLLSQLAGRVVEAALEAEVTEHLGHPPGGRPQGPNVRNGGSAKTVQTDLGPVQVKTPRDRDGSFEPQILPKRQTRLAGLDDKILGLYAGGMTVRDISAHLSELYGTQIGRDTISNITDAVLEDVQVWRTRPLDPVYPIVYFDAMVVKVREDRSVQNRACYLALGVTCDGEREVLGIWWQDTEGAKFWLAVLNARGLKISDRLVSLADPDARPIRKGKLGKPTEFGYVAQICEVTENTRKGARGFILPGRPRARQPGREPAPAPHRLRARPGRDPAARDRRRRRLPAGPDQRRLPRPQRRPDPTLRPPRTRLPQNPQTPSPLPHRHRGPHQPPQTRLRPTPLPTQGP